MPASGKGNLAISFFKVGLGYLAITLLLGLTMVFGLGYGIFGSQGAKAAHVHASLLGFVTMIIIGSMYQITPTLTGTSLYGGNLPKKQFWLMNMGILGMFIALLFLRGTLRTGFQVLFGVVVLIASLLYGYIIFRTLGESRSKIKPVTIPFFKAAIIFLLLGEFLGILKAAYPGSFSGLLLSKTAHAHLGTLGFITMTIFGAEYQMFPMLSLKKLKSESWARINLWSFIIGTAGFIISLLLVRAGGGLTEQRLVSLSLTLFVVVLLLSTYTFLGNMWFTLIGASWKKLDVSVKYLFFGQVFLLVTTFIGSSMAVFYHLGLLDWMVGLGFAAKGLSLYGLIWTHAHLALIGFVTLTIIGATYHLVPMLVWMERYGPKMGKEKVPNIQDLFSKKLAHAILYVLLTGLIGIYFGSLYGVTPLLRSSTLLIGAAGLVFVAEMIRIMK